MGSDIGFVEYLSSYLVGLEKSLPLLRISILDESLPLYVCGMKGLFAGGRVTDAMILGMFEYSKSIPELLEVAQHDLDYEMRATSVESVGEMKKESWNVVPQLCRSLLNDKSYYVKEHTAEALGKIGNNLAIESLRNSFDEAREVVKVYGLKGYPFNYSELNKFDRREADSACMLIENSLRALVKLNPTIGREAIAEGLNDENPVYHWVKRALFWYDSDTRKNN